MRARQIVYGIGLAGLLLLGACDLAGSPSAPGSGGAPGAGATPGGVQDMGFARELIANGQVPPAEAFVVEGMFSEHDLPLEGDPCTQLLCLRGALGVAPTLEGDPSAWLQIGLSSALNLDTYARPSLSLVFTVDISGSMDWEYTTPYNEYQTPLKVAKAQLERLIPTLTAEDEVAIVTYGSSAQTVLGWTSGTEQETLFAAVRGLKSEGSTNMEAGLETAYRTVQQAKTDNARRVLLFTDVQPNVGATEATEFERLVSGAADEEIGLTVFGVGLGLGPEVFDAMSQARGGNAFSLFGSRDVTRIMENDWPYLASPLAYDLRVSLTPQAPLEVAEGYGFPTTDNEASLETSTVFLSKRRGALLVRLIPAGESKTLAVGGTLSYETLEGERVEDMLAASFKPDPDARGHAFEQPSVGKTVALALLVSGMKNAAETYAEEQTRGAEKMQEVVTRFTADAEALGDASFEGEVALAEELLELMEAGAPQGTLYGD